MTAIDTLWILVCGILVFNMQPGFAMLEVGSVRSKNAQNILLKNVSDACVGTILWWCLGYFIAYNKHLKEVENESLWADWFFQWAFATTATTIVSGAIAERTKFFAYLVYSVVMNLLIYPIVVRFTWGGGFLSELGFLDFAGSGIVHAVGGIAGLVGAYVTEPRRDRFVSPELFKSHNMPLVILGTLMLWVSWYGFNCGSTLAFDEDSAVNAGLIAMNTSISAATSGLATLVLTNNIMQDKMKNIGSICNGILAGLVGITASCNNVYNYGAFIIGIMSALCYIGTSDLVKRLQIDDPLDAFAVHGACGILGTLAVGLFDKTHGLFYAHNAVQLGHQCIGALCITLWTLCTSFFTFFSLKQFKMLRISTEDEVVGLDESHHGGSAYEL